MGRLPTQFAGRQIVFRIPYEIAGELNVNASASGVQFPEATFLHNVDKPFEIHRMIPRLTALDSSAVVQATQPADGMLERLTRLRVLDFSKNEQLTKTPSLVSTMTKGTSERTWEWAEPYYLTRSEGMQVTVDNLAAPAFVTGYAATRVEICFQGFLVVIAPPSEQR